MPYVVTRNDAGRYQVTSSKGKTWKTTYPTAEAAQKGIAYVEARFTSPGAEVGTPSAATGESPDTNEERRKLGIPELEDEEEVVW